ncbi:MAG: hypothetical protein ACKOW3_04865 [Hyphomicrobium sp.]
MRPLLIGTLFTLCPLLLIGALFIKRNLPILAFYFVLCVIGFGYLVTTGAVEDIGMWALVFASQPPKD